MDSPAPVRPVASKLDFTDTDGDADDGGCAAEIPRAAEAAGVDAGPVVLSLLSVLQQESFARLQGRMGSGPSTRAQFVDHLAAEVATCAAECHGGDVRGSEQDFRATLARASTLSRPHLDALARSVDCYGKDRVTFAAFMEFVLSAGRTDEGPAASPASTESTPERLATVSRSRDRVPSPSLGGTSRAVLSPLTASRAGTAHGLGVSSRALPPTSALHVRLLPVATEPTTFLTSVCLAKKECVYVGTHRTVSPLQLRDCPPLPCAVQPPLGVATVITAVCCIPPSQELVLATSASTVLSFSTASGHCVRECRVAAPLSHLVHCAPSKRWAALRGVAKSLPSHGVVVGALPHGRVLGLSLHGTSVIRPSWTAAQPGPAVSCCALELDAMVACCCGDAVAVLCSLTGATRHIFRGGGQTVAVGTSGDGALAIATADAGVLHVVPRAQLADSPRELRSAVLRRDTKAGRAAIAHITSDPWAPGTVVTVDAAGVVAQWDVSALAPIPLWQTAQAPGIPAAQRPFLRFQGNIRAVATVPGRGVMAVGKGGAQLLGRAPLDEILRAEPALARPAEGPSVRPPRYLDVVAALWTAALEGITGATATAIAVVSPRSVTVYDAETDVALRTAEWPVEMGTVTAAAVGPGLSLCVATGSGGLFFASLEQVTFGDVRPLFAVTAAMLGGLPLQLAYDRRSDIAVALVDGGAVEAAAVAVGDTARVSVHQASAAVVSGIALCHVAGSGPHGLVAVADAADQRVKVFRLRVASSLLQQCASVPFPGATIAHVVLAPPLVPDGAGSHRLSASGRRRGDPAATLAVVSSVGSDAPTITLCAVLAEEAVPMAAAVLRPPARIRSGRASEHAEVTAVAAAAGAGAVFAFADGTYGTALLDHTCSGAGDDPVLGFATAAPVNRVASLPDGTIVGLGECCCLLPALTPNGGPCTPTRRPHRVDPSPAVELLSPVGITPPRAWFLTEAPEEGPASASAVRAFDDSDAPSPTRGVVRSLLRRRAESAKPRLPPRRLLGGLLGR